MSSKRRPQGDAEAEVRPEDEAIGKVVGTLDVADAASFRVEEFKASEAEEHAIRTVKQWAQDKGHIPQKKPIRFVGDLHKGPHIAVVMCHRQWPENKLVSEAEYDLAVDEAYSIPVGENLADRPQEG